MEMEILFLFERTKNESWEGSFDRDFRVVKDDKGTDRASWCIVDALKYAIRVSRYVFVRFSRIYIRLAYPQIAVSLFAPRTVHFILVHWISILLDVVFGPSCPAPRP